MEFSIFLDKKLNEEDLEFFASMLEEITLKKDNISYFLTQDACYSLAEILKIIEKIQLKTKASNKYIDLFIDLNEFRGLGLEKEGNIKDNAILNIKFLEKDDFYNSLFISSSNNDGRHLSFWNIKNY